MFSVYALSDPRTGQVRYVGFTGIPPARRLRYHIKEKKKTRKRNWITSLRAAGHRPAIELLESFEERARALEAEAEWISMLRHVGCDLVNIADGGRSPTMTAETRAKMSAAHKGKVRSPEHLAALSAAGLVRPRHTEETRAKMRAAKLGTKWSPARRACPPVVGRKHTFESIAKMRSVHQALARQRRAA